MLNRAHIGGGFYVSFQDSAEYNSVTLTNSFLDSNVNFDVDELTKESIIYDADGGGGGGKILYSSADISIMVENTMEISNCSFLANRGIAGGALWVESVLELDSTSSTLTIKNCSFNGNGAFLGSALYFSGKFWVTTTYTLLEDNNFSSNIPLCTSQHFAYLPCAGTLYTINFPVSLGGKIVFHGNKATAIEIHEGSIDVTNGSDLVFIENSSLYAGALAFYDCSFMTVYPKTTIKFVNNHADGLGGAIFSASCSGSSQPLSLSFRCFIEYAKHSVHPNDWKTVISFKNNTIKTGDDIQPNDMYITSLSGCSWPKYGSDVIEVSDYAQTFCWIPFEFSDNCNTSYMSSPAFLKFTTQTFSIFPGQRIPLPTVYDGSLRQIKDIDGVVACVLSGPGSFASNESITCRTAKDISLFYPGDRAFTTSKHVSISVRLNEKIEYGPTFFVRYTNCEWPFTFIQSQCVYENRRFFQCDVCGIGSDVFPKHQFCITSGSADGLVVGQCPPAYNNVPVINWFDRNNLSDADSCRFHKSGRLCGGCTESYGVPLNSLHYICHDCSKSPIPGLILFILLEIFPVTLFILCIFVFGIDLSKGVTSGFVFYWQIITLNFQTWFYPSWFTFSTAPDDKILNSNYTRIATFLYSVTNLDFLVIIFPDLLPICISSRMESLGAIAFWYIVPLYALVVTAVILTWLTQYERGMLCVMFVTKPLHKCLARFWSRCSIKSLLMSSVASVYVLCFVQLAAISFKLLHFTTWHSLRDRHLTGKAFFYDGNKEYFGMPHLLFGLLAIFILLVLVFPPMLFVLLFPSRFFHRFVLNKVKWARMQSALVLLGDTYTGCFKDSSTGELVDCRYFAGTLFFIRIVIMMFYFIPGQYSKLILYFETATLVFLAGVVMIFRPYKEKIANFTNFFLFILLALMTTICLFFERKGVIVNLFFVMHLPLLLAIPFIIKWLKLKVISAYNSSHGSYVYFNAAPEFHTAVTDDDDEVVPDHLENPGEYQSGSIMKIIKDGSSTKKRANKADQYSRCVGYGAIND